LEPIPNHDHQPSNLASQLPEEGRDPTALHESPGCSRKHRRTRRRRGLTAKAAITETF
jgi:hypothetical protein